MSRECAYCTARVVRHDDIIPWRCTYCDRLLYDDETKPAPRRTQR